MTAADQQQQPVAPGAGSRRTHKKKEQRRRKKERERAEARQNAVMRGELLDEAQLRAEGLNEAQIAKVLEQRSWDQLVASVGLRRAAQIRYDNAPDQPNDSRYRPTPGDPLLRGPARATGDTARSVKSRRGLAAWQMSSPPTPTSSQEASDV